MSDFVGKPERETQNRVIKLFREELGYSYLGDLHDKNNSNIDEATLTTHLRAQNYDQTQIQRAIHALKLEADNPNRTLHENNKAVYSLLRYGVSVKTGVGENHEQVHLIDWENYENNDFAIAEEVTVRGVHEKRPDIVLFINGIAIAVMELKNSRVSINEGVRQSIVNQQKDFISQFFSTVQIIFAGNDSQGLLYGTVGTSEKYFLKWKEDEGDDTRFKLDKYLLKMCEKKRVLELIYDFVIFDGGRKKLPRVHQYFAVKATQEHIRSRKSGIIWHSQGSGKSIVMVLTAKWILENNPKARVLIITDRDELDAQIERVFTEAGEKKIVRAKSGAELLNALVQPTSRLLCSLIHKFGNRDDADFEQFIKQIENSSQKAVGEFFVFVDECHRTNRQSGKLHRAMKAFLGDAVFFGFTGTPLLRADKETTLEVFGSYIHTYKFDEAVQDEVVLDLIYEARDIDQNIESQDKIDAWFEAKTRGLNDWKKTQIQEHWATMQKVLSSRSRMEKVISDIVFDFDMKPRLSDDRGNALLVASSIYEACRYFELFQKTRLGGKCGIVTSCNPDTQNITTDDTGENTETEKEYIYKTYTELLKNVTPTPGKSRAETYEAIMKDKFVNKPAEIKLLIVVDKLLTGFDAPSCTYLYIDKHMQDHGLFQAICRVNRLDGETKPFGYIVDYKDLLKKVNSAIAVYTSELEQIDRGDGQIRLKDRLENGRKALDGALEAIRALCELVAPPMGEMEYIRYFCGNSENDCDLKETQLQRETLYKLTSSLVRAYSNICDDMRNAGYDENQIRTMKDEVRHYCNVREVVRNASGESLDLKSYEADMRYLIDTYINASSSEKISAFEDIGLLEMFQTIDIKDLIGKLPEWIKRNQDATAETIENNVRRKIIKDHLRDPAFYEKMSKLLNDIIAARRQKAIDYEEYLCRIEELAKRINTERDDGVPQTLDTPGKRALYNNLGQDEQIALSIDKAIKETRQADWKGNMAKERDIKRVLFEILQNDDETERIFKILKEQAEY